MLAPDTTKKVVIGCLVVGALAVAGGLLYHRLARRKEEAEDDLHFKIPPQAPATPKGGGKAKAEPTPSAAADSELDALADELLQGTASGPAGSEEGYETFADIGLKCKAPEGWELAAEDGPTPQIAVVKLYPKGLTEEQRMDPSAFGTHPNIMVMVEDTIEPMSAKEYKDKSKEMAVRSGQGMMQIVGDKSVHVGPFEYQLEGSQPIPDPSQGRIMHIKFLNLLTMKGSCGYAVQYISPDDTFQKYLDFVLEWAATIRIMDLAPRAKSVLQYTSPMHEVQLSVPWAWNAEKGKKSDSRDAIVAFKTSAQNYDIVTVYKAKEPYATAQEHLEQQLKGVDATASSITTDGAVGYCTYSVDGKEVALYGSAAYAVEVRPDARKHTLQDAVLRDILSSIQPIVATVEKSVIRYINNHHRFSFETASDCTLAEFKFGTTAVMYSPVQQPAEDPESIIPVFKVFVNKEQEEYADLKAVETKLREACDPSTPMRDCKVEKYGDREWLTFTTSFMDGPYGPFGPREEYRSKVFICLRGTESFMLKWEVADNEWRRYERHLNQLMESFLVMG